MFSDCRVFVKKVSIARDLETAFDDRAFACRTDWNQVLTVRS
jgi:hypothetical protein